MASRLLLLIHRLIYLFTGLPYGNPSRKMRFSCLFYFILFYFFTGLPYGNPNWKMGDICFFSLFFFLFFFLRVKKILPLLIGVFVHRVFCVRIFVRFEEAGVMRRFL